MRVDQWRPPYLGMALPPVLGVLLVLLQGGPGLPLQAAHLLLVFQDQAVPLRAELLLQPRPLLLLLQALLSHLIGQSRQGETSSANTHAEQPLSS